MVQYANPVTRRNENRHEHMVVGRVKLCVAHEVEALVGSLILMLFCVNLAENASNYGCYCSSIV
jgi:hypothetical protein